MRLFLYDDNSILCLSSGYWGEGKSYVFFYDFLRAEGGSAGKEKIKLIAFSLEEK